MAKIKSKDSFWRYGFENETRITGRHCSNRCSVFTLCHPKFSGDTKSRPPGTVVIVEGEKAGSTDCILSTERKYVTSS